MFLDYQIELVLPSAENPNSMEIKLMKKIQKSKWIKYAHLLIAHGREVCKARKPNCYGCLLVSLCKRNSVI